MSYYLPSRQKYLLRNCYIKKNSRYIYTLFNTGGVYCMRSFYAVAFDKTKLSFNAVASDKTVNSSAVASDKIMV
jgi:hypothetical protein